MEPPAPSPAATTSRPGLWRRLLPTNWQFSIRELLLLTAAVAAFLAWALFYQRSQPFRPTSIPERVCDLEPLHRICDSLGHPASYSLGEGGPTDMHASTYCYERQLGFPPSRRAELMEAYREVVRGTLAKNVDQVWGAGTTRDGRGLRGFKFNYSQDRTQGSVFVRCSDWHDGIELFIFIHEHQMQP